MNNSYWKDYWENYYKFMAIYLRELQNIRPNQDIKEEYLDVAAFLSPPVDTNKYFDFDLENFYNDDNYSFGTPNVNVSSGVGQFSIENCERMPLLQIEMKQGYNPSRFYMIVSEYDNTSISGYRIACDNNGNITFIELSLEYININSIECAFQ